jgi:hypothetical protein
VYVVNIVIIAKLSNSCSSVVNDFETIEHIRNRSTELQNTKYFNTLKAVCKVEKLLADHVVRLP